MTEFVVGKNPCPFHGCGSSDGFHWYGEGNGGYCYSCNKSILSDERKAELGIDKFEWTDEMEAEVSTKELITEDELAKIKSYTGVKGMGARNIPDDVYKAYACRFKYSEETGEVVETFYPYTEGYKAAGFKIRVMNPKDFRSCGRIGKDSDLFGQWKWKNGGGKYLVLCSGEADTLAAFTMLENYRKSRSSDFDPIPCVSAAIGEAGAWKQVQKHYEWINTYDRVVVLPDMDEAGQKALKKLSEVLPKGKMFVAKLPAKDVNKMLDEGREKQFIRCFYDAAAYSPDGILGSDSLMNKIIEQVQVPKIPLPPFMHKVQKQMAGGIPLSTISCLGSASGTGKSTFIDEMVYYWVFNSPHKVGILSLESDGAQYGIKMLSRHVGRKIDLIETVEEKLEFLNSPEVQEAANHLFKNEDGTPRWHLIEERDGGIESVKDLIMQLVIQCGCRVICIDPVQDLLEGSTNEEQGLFMKWLKGMVKSHSCSFVLINHIRKSTGGQKANSTGADIHEEDFAGSSTLFKSSACNLLFTRNKEADEEVEKNTTYMKMTKCRWTGNTGMSGQYYYDNTTHTLYDKDDWLQQNPQQF